MAVSSSVTPIVPISLLRICSFRFLLHSETHEQVRNIGRGVERTLGCLRRRRHDDITIPNDVESWSIKMAYTVSNYTLGSNFSPMQVPEGANRSNWCKRTQRANEPPPWIYPARVAVTTICLEREKERQGRRANASPTTRFAPGLF